MIFPLIYTIAYSVKLCIFYTLDPEQIMIKHHKTLLNNVKKLQLECRDQQSKKMFIDQSQFQSFVLCPFQSLLLGNSLRDGVFWVQPTPNGQLLIAYFGEKLFFSAWCKILQVKDYPNHNLMLSNITCQNFREVAHNPFWCNAPSSI